MMSQLRCSRLISGSRFTDGLPLHSLGNYWFFFVSVLVLSILFVCEANPLYGRTNPEHLPSDCKNYSNYHSIDCTKLNLTTASFFVPTDTVRLSFQDNLISVLPFIGYLSRLKELDMQSNKIVEIPGSFFNLICVGIICQSSLETLLFSDNDIKALPNGLFGNLTNITYMYFDSNFISELPSGLFVALRKLKVLNFENNMLITLSTNIFSDLIRLHTLNLGKNNIASLPMYIFESLTSLVMLI